MASERVRTSCDEKHLSNYAREIPSLHEFALFDESLSLNWLPLSYRGPLGATNTTVLVAGKLTHDDNFQ